MSLSKLDCVMSAPGAGMVVVAAGFAVPPDRLFRALTESAEIACWWGGRRGGSFVTWSGRAEPGAVWQAEGLFSRNRSFFASGAFLAVEPGRSLVQSWHASWDEMIATEASMKFEATPEGTLLTLVHKGFEGRDAACQAQAQFWWRVVKWLQLYLRGDIELSAAS
jgi:uncharacterized protein YndB with AHSA1/START domain